MNNNFYDIKNIPFKELIPGFRARVIHTQKMTFVYWHVTAGSILPEHHHFNEQIVHLLDGKFDITIDGKNQILTTGSIAVIPSNSVHKGQAISDCYILDIFSPVRSDY